MAAQTGSAAQAISEYLKSPDDLVKVAAFRKKLEKEKASIDSRLKAGVKEQLEATRNGLRKMLGTRANVQIIKDEMYTVDTQCNNPQNVIATFDQISRVSMVHRNFQQVEEMVNSLKEMDSKLDALEDMLAGDSRSVIGPASNLLAIHFHVNQLEAFRSQTVHQAKKASAESRAILARRFDRLLNFVKEFEDYYSSLCHSVVALVREGYPSVVVKLIKIAEIEGKEDEKAIAIRLVKKAAKMDAASKFRSMQANARVIKHYRSKMTKSISESIRDSFDAALERVERDPNAFIENLGWMYDDLLLIESDVVPCFPSDWSIFSLYVREYHKSLNETLKKIIADKPGAGFLLSLHDWIKEYKKNMKKLEVPAEWLEPPLLEGKEATLLEDYVQVIIQKIDEWSKNLMKTEVEQFSARTEQPEVDVDGMYGTQAPFIFFNMVNQQIDLATESGQGGILSRVVTESSRVMRQMQEQWMQVVAAEYKKQVEKPEEAAGGLGEYCIALANDQIKCADYTETLSAKLEPLVSEKYKVVISERLNEGIDGYLDVAKKCTQALIDIVFNDLKPATKQMFQSPWHEPNGNALMIQIIETIRDYMNDWQQLLNPSILDLLIEDLLDAFLVAYLGALANATKLRMNVATTRIREDVKEAFRFFCSVKPEKELEVYFEVIELILGLLEASRDFIALAFMDFAKVHGPNLSFVEGLMKARDDLDRSAVGEVMDSIKRRVKEDKIVDPAEPTIMKKITIQNAFTRLLRQGLS